MRGLVFFAALLVAGFIGATKAEATDFGQRFVIQPQPQFVAPQGFAVQRQVVVGNNGALVQRNVLVPQRAVVQRQVVVGNRGVAVNAGGVAVRVGNGVSVIGRGVNVQVPRVRVFRPFGFFGRRFVFIR